MFRYKQNFKYNFIAPFERVLAGEQGLFKKNHCTLYETAHLENICVEMMILTFHILNKNITMK
jgi:hypothetical protein